MAKHVVVTFHLTSLSIGCRVQGFCLCLPMARGLHRSKLEQNCKASFPTVQISIGFRVRDAGYRAWRVGWRVAGVETEP